MASRSQLKRQAEAKAKAWNAAHPVGTPVVFVMGDVAYQAATTAPAAVFHDHHPMVDLDVFPHTMFLHAVWPLSPTPPAR